MSNNMTQANQVSKAFTLAGFTPEHLHRTVAHYNNLIKTGPPTLDLHTVARRLIELIAQESGDACLEGDDYGRAWKAMGMRQEIIDELLKEEYKSIRLAKSASAHLKHSILVTAVFLDGQKEKAKAKELGEPVETGPPMPGVEKVVPLPRRMDGCYMLYIVGSVERLETIWPDRNTSEIDLGKVQMDDLMSDFTLCDEPFVLATIRPLETAQKYCKFRQILLGNHIKQGILHIAAPYELMQQMSWIKNADWAEMMWYNRTVDGQAAMGPMPESLLKYFQGVGLGGNVCAQSVKGIASMTSKEEIRPMLEGGQAVEFYLLFPKGIERLNEMCRGSLVWLEELQGVEENRLSFGGKGRFREMEE